jgi:hypothetical protein
MRSMKRVRGKADMANQVLVSTPVVEVGADIPTPHDADRRANRFGLAQPPVSWDELDGRKLRILIPET